MNIATVIVLVVVFVCIADVVVTHIKSKREIRLAELELERYKASLNSIMNASKDETERFREMANISKKDEPGKKEWQSACGGGYQEI